MIRRCNKRRLLSGVAPASDNLARMRSLIFSAVIFDWRGTLVTTLSSWQWVEEGLRRANLEFSPARVGELLRALEETDPDEIRLDGPGVDSGTTLHRETDFEVFRDAGIDYDLPEALYAVESDHRFNVFAADVAPTLRRLKESGVQLAVLSDIHFDICPTSMQQA